MSDPAFITASALRAYLELNAVASSSKYDDGTLGSNIRAASSFLQRRTGRQFANQAGVTKTFTTHGRASIVLPGLRTATIVSLQGTALTADSTYWLQADSQQSGVTTGITFRAYGRASYLANPEWFDRNLDRLYERFGSYSSLPNDLTITGDWGYLDADLPEPLLHATKVLAAYYTKRPDSILASVATTVEGTTLDYSTLPPEVTEFVRDWTLGEMVVTVG